MADGSEQPATKVLKEYQLKHLGDPEKMEYFVPFEWAQTVPIDQAFDDRAGRSGPPGWRP